MNLLHRILKAASELIDFITLALPPMHLVRKLTLKVNEFSYIGSNFSVGYDQNAMKAGNFPLVYWKDKGRQFPTLRSLARVYLSIPATSVPSERVFSSAGRVLTDRRSMLSGKRLEMLVVCKKNISLW